MRTAICIILVLCSIIFTFTEGLSQNNLNEFEIRLHLKNAVLKNNIKEFRRFVFESSSTKSEIKKRLTTSEDILKDILSFTDSVFHSSNLKHFYKIYPDLSNLFEENVEYSEVIAENFSMDFKNNIVNALSALNGLDDQFFEQKILPDVLFVGENIIQIKNFLSNNKFHNKKIYKMLMREYEQYSIKKE
jgi:hypothetical protein